MIKHVHVNDCDSTQDLLKEQLNSGDTGNILVSCENQLLGRGRGEKTWTAMPGTLCLSMNVTPHTVPSFTALELAVITARFFEHKGRSLKLKWPNDLWSSDLKKAGGILVQGVQGHFLAGIGVNLYSSADEYGGIFVAEFELEKKVWAREISEYILQNRYQSAENLKADWLERCGHLNQRVTVKEGSETTEGIFIGLGDHGEALLSQEGSVTRIYNGTLRV